MANLIVSAGRNSAHLLPHVPNDPRVGPASGSVAQTIVQTVPRARATVAPTPYDYSAGDRAHWPGERTLGRRAKITALDAYRLALDLERQVGTVPDERLADPSFGAATMVKYGTSIRGGGGAKSLPSDKGITRSDERTGDFKIDSDVTAVAGLLLLEQRAAERAKLDRERAAQRRLGSQYTGADTWPGATPRAKKAAAKKAATPRTRFTTCCFQVIALTAECGCATDVTSAPVHAHA